MQRTIHPLHAMLLAGSFPLFLGVLLTDVAYFYSHEVQWKNFASWLIVGALLFSGLSLPWALAGAAGTRWRVSGRTIYLLVLAVAWILGLLNAFVHAGDAWASMPQGLVIAVIDTVLIIVALGLGFYSPARGAT
ncbi:MAG TPA: hypothetical protein VFZ95_08635 [Steroidobacteraceae bacterium]